MAVFHVVLLYHHDLYLKIKTILNNHPCQQVYHDGGFSPDVIFTVTGYC